MIIQARNEKPRKTRMSPPRRRPSESLWEAVLLQTLHLPSPHAYPIHPDRTLSVSDYFIFFLRILFYYSVTIGAASLLTLRAICPSGEFCHQGLRNRSARNSSLFSLCHGQCAAAFRSIHNRPVHKPAVNLSGSMSWSYNHIQPLLTPY